MTFLCIKNGVVVNAIVAEQEFVDTNTFLQQTYDACINWDDLKDPKPWIGWLHDGVNFSEAVAVVEKPPQDKLAAGETMTVEELQTIVKSLVDAQP